MPPSSLPGMESVDAKLIRAGEHLDTFRAECTKFLQVVKNDFIIDHDPDLPEARIIVQVNAPEPPMRLSTIIGDCLFNMRSALDNLLCAVVRRVDPSSACPQVLFPICQRPGCWAEAIRTKGGRLTGVPEDARTIIKELQPCFRTKASPLLDPLAILDNLVNTDKHRALHLTTAFCANSRFAITTSSGVPPFHVWVQKPIYAGDQEAIVLRDIDPVTLRAAVHVEANGANSIAFRDASKRFGRNSADEVLVACLEYVENAVIPRFKPFFT